jgi:hypothetical protein
MIELGNAAVAMTCGLWDPCDVANTARRIAAGEEVGKLEMAASGIPVIPGIVGRWGDDVLSLAAKYSDNAVRLADRSLKLYDIVRYGQKAPGFHKHHGVLDIWATHNVPNYIQRSPDAPTILLSPDQHRATFGVFNRWRAGRTIDWTTISPRDVQRLSEQMFDAAGVPSEARASYYRAFSQYIYGLNQ